MIEITRPYDVPVRLALPGMPAVDCVVTAITIHDDGIARIDLVSAERLEREIFERRRALEAITGEWLG